MATGPVKGGHCYLLLGYDPSTDLFEFDNSWGTAWGVNGRFFMSATDFDTLVMQDPNGEACAGLELPAPPSGRLPNIPGPFALSEDELSAEIQRSSIH